MILPLQFFSVFAQLTSKCPCHIIAGNKFDLWHLITGKCEGTKPVHFMVKNDAPLL